MLIPEGENENTEVYENDHKSSHNDTKRLGYCVDSHQDHDKYSKKYIFYCYNHVTWWRNQAEWSNFDDFQSISRPASKSLNL